MIGFLLNQEAIVIPLRKETFGETLYDEPYYVKCRIDTGKKLVKAITVHGDVEAVVANAIMFVVQDEIIPPKSIVKGEYRDYVVIRCDEMRGFNKSHLEVYLE